MNYQDEGKALRFLEYITKNHSKKAGKQDLVPEPITGMHYPKQKLLSKSPRFKPITFSSLVRRIDLKMSSSTAPMKTNITIDIRIIFEILRSVIRGTGCSTRNSISAIEMPIKIAAGRYKYKPSVIDANSFDDICWFLMI